MKKMHCCDRMEAQVNYQCPDHENPFECPDHLIGYSAVFDEYGIMIHDGGSSMIKINFCPWCGAKLAKSIRDR